MNPYQKSCYSPVYQVNNILAACWICVFLVGCSYLLDTRIPLWSLSCPFFSEQYTRAWSLVFGYCLVTSVMTLGRSFGLLRLSARAGMSRKWNHTLTALGWSSKLDPVPGIHLGGSWGQNCFHILCFLFRLYTSFAFY